MKSGSARSNQSPGLHPGYAGYPNVIAYRERLNGWAPFARAVDEARPFRPYFPLGAPERD